MLLAALATLMVAGYLVGRVVNKRRVQVVSAWLEPGMRSLGGAPTVQAVNRTAFRVKVTQARNPFAVVTATVVLISRESLPTWVWELIQRRHDLLVFHVTLKRAPAMEAEIANVSSVPGQRGEAEAKLHGWTTAQVDGPYRVYHSATTAPDEACALAADVAGGRFAPWRVAVRRHAPHLLVSLPAPDIRDVSSMELTRWLRRLVKQLQAEQGNEAY